MQTKWPLILAFLCIPVLVSAQDENKKAARAILREAIRVMDNGDPDRAITMLDSAKKLDPEDYVYQYEIGYAIYLKKDYEKAIGAFQQTLLYKNSDAQCYQMLGNSYDYAGQRQKAIEAYQEGLKKYPNAGRLYHELGIVQLDEKNYDEAILWWEKGVAAQPEYPSNYYRLARLFSQSTDRLWALLYGELFMNIERNSKRTEEISQLIYDTYKESINLGDSTKVDLVSNVITIDNKKKFELPFKFVFGTDFVVALTPSVIVKDTLSIRVLSNARENFVKSWYKQKRDKKYPNLLLDFHNQLSEKGFLQAYNYWILMKGNEAEFENWYNENKKTYDEFAAWFNENPLSIDKKKYFLRTQYDK